MLQHIIKISFLLLGLIHSIAYSANNKGAASQAETTEHAPLPLQYFYQPPPLENPSLSPDGSHILALRNIQGSTVVLVYNVETGESFYPAKTDNTEFKFNWVRWGNNDRLLMSLRFTTRRNTTLNFDETRLLVIDAKKPSKMKELIKHKKDAWNSQFRDNIISMLPDDTDHILVSIDREMPNHQTVYKVNLNSRRMKRIKKYKFDVNNWMSDRQGQVRAGVGYDDKKREITITVLPPNADKWQTAWSYINLEEPSITPIGFGENPKDMYLLADHNGRKALFLADLSQPGFPKTLILSNPNFDISGNLIYSPNHKQVVGIYLKGSEQKSIFWHEEFKAFQAGLDKSLPDSSNYIISLSDDARKYIMYSENPTNPGTYYVGNRDKKTLAPVAHLYPELTKDVLVEKEHRGYKARDGLELDGYLSLPHNFTGTPSPTIIFPHGGPMSEDGKGFDIFSAFMVDRGYVVFQPNFRGSSGRGHDFMMRAVGGYGLEMQDDLEDAVHYLVAQGIADPKQVCIVGASYGGYAALMGATKTPDLFRCAVSFAGLSDLVKMRRTFRHYFAGNSYKKQFGDNKRQLKETSPARMVDRVKIPILLIHGSQDTSVPVHQSRLMAKRLKAANKEHTYIELKDGSHHLDYPPHFKQTIEAIDGFLNQHLPL